MILSGVTPAFCFSKVACELAARRRSFLSMAYCIIVVSGMSTSLNVIFPYNGLSLTRFYSMCQYII